MIGLLRGKVIDKNPPMVLLEVQGVGYEVEVPMSTFSRLPEISAETQLFTHLTVREDAHLLYGFYSFSEKQLFRQLIKVNGVGPKLALTILSGLSVAELLQCIGKQDTAWLVKLPGVGKKTAERLMIELKDKLPALSDGVVAQKDMRTLRTPSVDAMDALIALGFKPQEAERAVSRVDSSELSSEALVRLALRGM